MLKLEVDVCMLEGPTSRWIAGAQARGGAVA
jgi:hypothetical protein